MVRQKVKNPLSKAGFWVTIAIFAFIGLAQLEVFKESFGSYILPIVFFAALFFTTWLVFQYRTGEIFLVGQTGTRHTYRRKEEPFWFFGICIVFFLVGLFLTVALGSDLFLECEWSLINSCGYNGIGE